MKIATRLCLAILVALVCTACATLDDGGSGSGGTVSSGYIETSVGKKF